jgi:effector-binding domain-containing protein
MGYDIEIKDVAAQPMLAVRTRTRPAELPRVFRELINEVWRYGERIGVTPSGPSFGIFHEYGEEAVEVEAGFPVPAGTEGEGRVRAGEFPGGKVATTRHIGPYTKLGDAHQAMDEWIHAQGHDHGQPPREIYWTGPGDDPDSSKWQTEVQYPIG